MQLSGRLKALADLVSEGHILADVGCDHAYISIYLVENHRIPKAIAMDIGEGPLARARENILAHGLEEYINTRLSDGLEKLAPGEAQAILISGMGGPLMERILSQHPGRLEGVRELILQPQSEITHFRMFLNRSAYRMIQEDLVQEDGKFYPMIRAVPGRERCTPLEYRYGPRLLSARHPVLREYLTREEDTLRGLLRTLEGRPGQSAARRCAQIEKELEFTMEALGRYEC